MKRVEPQVKFTRAQALASLEALLSEERRAEARNSFDLATLGRSEAWWYTPLGNRLAPHYTLSDALKPSLELKADVTVLSFAEANALLQSTETHVEGLRAVAKRAQELLGKLATEKDQPYCALNTAYIERGLIIYVPNGAQGGQVRVTWPVGISDVSEQQDTACATLSRTLIICESNAQLSVTERFIQSDGELKASELSSHVTEIWVGNQAHLDYLRAQTTALTHQHIGRISASVQQKAKLKGTILNLGGALSRIEVEASLEGEGADVSLDGAFTGSAEQILDQHLTLRHVSPRCTSSQRFKGLIGGQARGVFTGRVYVAEGAVGTRAEQNNPNLLLTKDARAMTRPQLEIYNDDVECSHGATVGQLDEQALFYLRSRGLSQALSERMLAEAFIGEVIHQLVDEEILEEATRAIHRTLESIQS